MRFDSRSQWVLVTLAVFLAPLMAFAQTDTITGSRHDLTVNGPGPVKATTSTDLCLFCHATHIADPNAPHPLWNQKLSIVSSYNLYGSTTYKQINTQPSTRSKLCLSCHDGTVAIGQTYSNYSGRISVQGALPTADNFGTDLSTSHPFGFVMPAVDDGEMKLSLTTSPPVTSDPTVKLFDNRIECITCHEPHKPNFDTATQFMVRSNTAGALCLACHDSSRGVMNGWTLSRHASATNTVSNGAQLPYSTVAGNACSSCHAGHDNTSTTARLLRNGQEETCATCHGSSTNLSPALPNVVSELTSTYAHPSGLPVTPPHDAAETLPVKNSRHAECADCHNPHVAQATSNALPPAVPQSLAGVSGLSSSGSALATASHEYEVCFKCHADSTNKPQSSTYMAYGRLPVRTVLSTDPNNVRLDFASSVARHNVTQPARSGISPSLRPTMLDLTGNPAGRSMTASSYLYCADCHNNDSARGDGGTAANGPHGSKWPHIMERQYQLNSLPPQGAGGTFTGISYTSGISNPYALCDKCHDLDSRLNLGGSGTDSVFGKHQLHVVGMGVSCSVCHAAHGVQSGTATNNKHLVNFDSQIVAAIGSNIEPYVDTTRRQCFLVCHGVSHNGTGY